MAFMMPVVRNDWDIYNSNRSRKISEGSSTSSNSTGTSATNRSRKISESRSEGKGSFSSASRVEQAFTKHHSVPDKMSSRQFSRKRACSDSLPNRAKGSTSPKEKTPSRANSMKNSQSWIDKLKKFVKSKNEDERVKS